MRETCARYARTKGKIVGHIFEFIGPEGGLREWVAGHGWPWPAMARKGIGKPSENLRKTIGKPEENL